MVTMVRARARAVASKARARPSVTLLSDFSSISGVTPEMASVMPSTVPRKPRIGMAQVMKRMQRVAAFQGQGVVVGQGAELVVELGGRAAAAEEIEDVRHAPAEERSSAARPQVVRPAGRTQRRRLGDRDGLAVPGRQQLAPAGGPFAAGRRAAWPPGPRRRSRTSPPRRFRPGARCTAAGRKPAEARTNQGQHADGQRHAQEKRGHRGGATAPAGRSALCGAMRDTLEMDEPYTNIDFKKWRTIAFSGRRSRAV